MDLVIKHIYFNKLVSYTVTAKAERNKMLEAIIYYKYSLIAKGMKGFGMLMQQLRNYQEIDAAKVQNAENYYILKLVKKAFVSMKASIQHKIDQRQAEKAAIKIRNKDLVFMALQHWIKMYNLTTNQNNMSIKNFDALSNQSIVQQINEDTDDFERHIDAEQENQKHKQVGMSFGEFPLFSFRSDTKSVSSTDEQKSTARDKFKNLSEQEVAAEFERVRKEHEQLRLNKLKLQELKQKEIDDLKRKQEEEKQKEYYQNQQKKNEIQDKINYLRSQVAIYNAKVNQFSRIETEYSKIH